MLIINAVGVEEHSVWGSAFAMSCRWVVARILAYDYEIANLVVTGFRILK